MLHLPQHFTLRNGLFLWRPWNYSKSPTARKPISSPAGQLSSIPQLCLILCDTMDGSLPVLPVHHQLLELTQKHVHQVGDVIQPSYPLSSPSSPTFNLSQHQGLFQWVSSLHQAAKVLEFQLQHQSFQWTFRTDFLETLNMTVSGQRVFADISKTSWVKNILDYIQWCVLVRDRRPRTQRQSPREDGNRDGSYAATSQGGSEPQKFRNRQGRFLPQSLWSDYNSANTLTVTWSRIVRE